MNKLGVSLPWDYLSDTILRQESDVIKSNFGSCTTFLKVLKAEGITSIELRHRHKNLTCEDMHKAVTIVREFEFSLTIHGETLPETSVLNFNKLFPWHKIIDELYENDKSKIIVTFHPLIKKKEEVQLVKLTVEILKKLLTSNNLFSCKYALENQRYRGYIDPGVTFKGIFGMISRVPKDKIGICWDMGHSYANVINYNQPLFPPEEFLKRVIHTHIHDLGPAGETHWMFKENQVPLYENVKLLQSYNYRGVYNLELSFNRFAEEPDINGLVMKTIEKLRKLII